jgi:hypothetical protein
MRGDNPQNVNDFNEPEVPAFPFLPEHLGHRYCSKNIHLEERIIQWIGLEVASRRLYLPESHRSAILTISSKAKYILDHMALLP